MLADQLVLDADGDVHEGEWVQLGQHHVEPLHHLLAMINTVKAGNFVIGV